MKTTESLQWRHNGRDVVSNHRRLDHLVNHLFRCKSKKTPRLRITGLCEGNSPVTGEFPQQRASNAENVSIWWRHSRRMRKPQFYVSGKRPMEATYVINDNFDSRFGTQYRNRKMRPVATYDNRADYRHTTSQWETSLLSNAVSRWLGANLESALDRISYRKNSPIDLKLDRPPKSNTRETHVKYQINCTCEGRWRLEHLQ